MNKQTLIECAQAALISSGKYNKIYLAVPYDSGSIDMLLVDNEQTLTVVYFESENWRLALKKARAASLGAGRAYICVPHDKLRDIPSADIKHQGIGIFTFNPHTHALKEMVAPVSHTTSMLSCRDSILRGISASPCICPHTS